MSKATQGQLFSRANSIALTAAKASSNNGPIAFNHPVYTFNRYVYTIQRELETSLQETARKEPLLLMATSKSTNQVQEEPISVDHQWFGLCAKLDSGLCNVWKSRPTYHVCGWGSFVKKLIPRVPNLIYNESCLNNKHFVAERMEFLNIHQH